MLACEPGGGPFLQGQCPDIRRLQPVQVDKILLSLDAKNVTIISDHVKHPFFSVSDSPLPTRSELHNTFERMDEL